MTELEYSEFLKGETDLEREAALLTLEHHGIKGQKHGVRRGPPYPLERGKSGSSKKKKKGSSIFSKLAKRKAAKKKTAASKSKSGEKKAEKKEEESKEKIREKVLSSTDPKYIYKYRNLLSTGELNDRINRINKEKDLKKLADGNQKAALKQAEDFLKTSASMAESITKIYNSYNAISNQMNRKKQEMAKQEEERRRKIEERKRNKNKQQQQPQQNQS